MGEKRKMKAWDYACKGCGKKFLMENLDKDGYVDHIKLGKVVFCPHCEHQELLENN